MHIFHRIKDITTLDGPTFFTLAYRLPAYEGAARLELAHWVERIESSTEEIRPFTEEDRAALYPGKAAEEIREEQRRMEARQTMLEDEGRVATLEELLAAGPAAPLISENVPIFEIKRPTD